MLRRTLLIALAAALVGTAAAAESFAVKIEVDARRAGPELAPVWRFFGADEPNYATMKDGRALLAGDLDRDHVALDELAEVDAGVEASADQVRAAVPFGGDVQHHIGIVAGELREPGPDVHGDRYGRRQQADGAGRLRAQFADLGEHVLDLVERGTQPRQHTLARLRGHLAPRRRGWTRELSPDRQPLEDQVQLDQG